MSASRLAWAAFALAAVVGIVIFALGLPKTEVKTERPNDGIRTRLIERKVQDRTVECLVVLVPRKDRSLVPGGIDCDWRAR